MKSYSFSMLFLLLLASCNTATVDDYDQVSSQDTIKIIPSDVPVNRINYSDFFDSVAYIPIETDSDFLIGKIDKILVENDYLFILDSEISKSVFCVNKLGQKVFRICKIGKGPGEYLTLSDIAFDSSQRELLVYCRVLKKLIHYDMNGNYVSEEPIPYMAWRVQPVGDNIAVSCEYFSEKKLKESNVFSNIALIDLKKDLVLSKANKFKAPVVKKVVWTSNGHFSKINDTLFSIKPDHCNTVYHITPSQIYAAYTLDFGIDYRIDDRYWLKARKKDISLKEVEDYCVKLRLCESYRFLESDEYIYFAYKQSGKVSYALFSKRDKRLNQYQYLQNDMDLVTLFNPIAIVDNRFYCILNAEDLYQIKEALLGNDRKTTLPYDLINRVHEFDNPIVAILTHK